MTITGTITLNNRPLRRIYVKQSTFFGDRFYITNNDGRVTIDADGSEVDIEVLAHNSVIRILTPIGTIPTRVKQSVRLVNNQTVEIEHERRFYHLVRAMKQIYDEGLREFSPWESEFPSGDNARSAFILELIIPDWLPDHPDLLAYTEPSPAFSDYPLIHLQNSDWSDLGTQAHELGHALHFSKLSAAKRWDIEVRYIGFLLDQGTHNFIVATTPFVAFIESFAIFSDTYFNNSNRSLSGEDRYQDFFAFCRNTLPTTVMGDDTEGAVFFCLFVEYADMDGIGLPFVVRTYVESEALNFIEYAEYIRDRFGLSSRQYSALRDAASIWGMPSIPVAEPLSCIHLSSHCLGKNPPISIVDDILHDPPRANQTVSLLNRLNNIYANCY